jgi:hypothetical protein
LLAITYRLHNLLIDFSTHSKYWARDCWQLNAMR